MLKNLFYCTLYFLYSNILLLNNFGCSIRGYQTRTIIAAIGLCSSHRLALCCVLDLPASLGNWVQTNSAVHDSLVFRL